MIVECHTCKKETFKSTGHYNRAIKLGAKLFCSQKCFGVSRQKDLTIEQKKEHKRLYDIEYRRKNLERIKQNKKIHFQKDYKANPEKYRAIRNARMKTHVEYCRNPDYKAKKHIYDRARYAKEKFGDAWESHVLIMEIGEECAKRMSKYEIRLKNKTLNKALQRSRNGSTKRSYT